MKKTESKIFAEIYQLQTEQSERVTNAEQKIRDLDTKIKESNALMTTAVETEDAESYTKAADKSRRLYDEKKMYELRLEQLRKVTVPVETFRNYREAVGGIINSKNKETIAELEKMSVRMKELLAELEQVTDEGMSALSVLEKDLRPASEPEWSHSREMSIIRLLSLVTHYIDTQAVVWKSR